MSERSRNERRLLMIAASERDEAHSRRLFAEDSIQVDFCRSVEELVYAAEDDAATILLSDIALRHDRVLPLIDFLSEQPPWSDLPVILVTSDERPGWLKHNEPQNLAILRQPVHVDSLLSLVRASLASRERQYQVRDLLEEQATTQLELRQIDRRKDEFLATLAHELRNPIAPIKSALDLVQIGRKTLTNESELVEIMTRQVQQLIRLIDDLLDVSRITRGKIRLIRKVIDLRDSILCGIEEARPFILKSGQELSVSLGDKPIFVHGDESRLSQCVANLLNNAAKYTQASGKIAVQADMSKGMAKVMITDNGIGIAPDQISSVFELFRQHDVDRERGQAGLGIGLTLVQRLVDLHGGTVTVSSQGIGTGSTFTMRFPTATPLEGKSGGPDASFSLRESQGCKILLVEDTRAVRFVTKQLLEIMGHEVSEAVDGVEGLEKASQLDLDLIISDISMPRMNGIKFAKEIRQNPQLDGVMLVAMTGYGRGEDREEALAAGFNRHITKPVDIAVLEELLREVANPGL